MGEEGHGDLPLSPTDLLESYLLMIGEGHGEGGTEGGRGTVTSHLSGSSIL